MAPAAEVTLPGYGGDPIRGTLARPEADGQRPGVIVLGDVFGLSDHFRAVAGRLAEAGYTALALDIFSRGGLPEARPVAEDLPKVAAFADRLPDQQVLGDVVGAVAWLKTQTDASGRVGCIGFCLGGMYAQMAMASPGGPDAAVDLYGRVRHARLSNAKLEHPIDMVPRTRGPLLALFGAKDPIITRGHIEALRRALAAVGQPFEVHIYEGAGHAFFHDGRPEYHPASAADAWLKALDWFAQHLGA
jgi:carboxymethylenebutenolidase